jgi:hypothetical protein
MDGQRSQHMQLCAGLPSASHRAQLQHPRLPFRTGPQRSSRPAGTQLPCLMVPASVLTAVSKAAVYGALGAPLHVFGVCCTP